MLYDSDGSQHIPIKSIMRANVLIRGIQVISCADFRFTHILNSMSACDLKVEVDSRSAHATFTFMPVPRDRVIMRLENGSLFLREAAKNMNK